MLYGVVIDLKSEGLLRNLPIFYFCFWNRRREEESSDKEDGSGKIFFFKFIF